MISKIKVFIVENSILMQKVISEILSADPQIEVIGCAKSGREAQEMIPKANPSVVTLDMNLPDGNGLTVIKELMYKFPVRIIIISAYTQNGADLTLKAIEAGALDFVSKPSGEISLDLYSFKDEIISKIKMAANIDLNKDISVSKRIIPAKESLLVNKIVVIGASTGGPKALAEVLKQIPANIDAGFLIVQHMPRGFTKSFAQRVSWYANIKIKESEDKDMILKGAGYIGCAGSHMLIEKAPEEKNQYYIKLNENPRIQLRPSLDILMDSVAKVFAGKIIGVILTGMGRDGLEGAKKIKEKGGRIIVQDEATCTIYGMPKAIVDAGLADDILPLSRIPEKIIEYLNYG